MTNIEPTNSLLDVGRRIGQGQAFSLVASKCSSALAHCLLSLRDEEKYKSLDLTWEQFCTQHFGISRVYADQLIRKLQEFGDAYFRLSEIMHISDCSYREIAAAVTPDAIEFDGQTIPFTPENAARIKDAVAQLRGKVKQSRSRRAPDVLSLWRRLRACFADLEQIARTGDTPDPALQAL